MRLAPLLLALLAALPAAAAEPPTRIPEAALDTAAQLRDIALADDTGWKVTESLTTEVGPRVAGSPADARAVEWARAKFAELGFDKVWTEPVTFPKWERRGQHAEVLGPHSQALAQNVAAYAVFTYLAAQAEGDFGSSPDRAVNERR